MRLSLLLFSLLLSAGLLAQNITHGPVIGDASPNSVRMYVRTTSAMSLDLEVSPDSTFNTGVLSFSTATIADKDSSVIFPITGLQPATTYYYRLGNGSVWDTVSGYFKTFPAPDARGEYTWVVLSCQEFGTYNAFNAIYDQQPEFMLHLGDWTYPSYMIPGDFRLDTAKIERSYRMRYSEKNMPKVLRSTVTDYVVDDDDGAGYKYNISDATYTTDSAGNPVNGISIEPVPAQGILNVRYGYHTYYPTYPMVDSTDGMYHSYKYGNAEVFFVDVRNCGTGLDSTFIYDSIQGKWLFEPRPGQTLLGQQQLQWLKDGLAASTADWKFIASGVMFNRKFRKIIQFAMALQNFQMSIGGQTGTGFRLAHALACNWPGFPAEQDGLLQFIEDNDIKDVIVLSGQMHTTVMDDGYNAGLPELNCGPAAGIGPELTYYVDSLMQTFGQGAAIDSLWNGGGLGVNNTNFNSAFGKVEIFSNDSVVLHTIDENNLTVSSMTVLHSSKVTAIPETKQIEACVVDKVYPNPTGNSFSVKLCTDYTPKTTDRAYLVNIQGQVTPVDLNGQSLFQIDVSLLPVGQYLLIYDHGPELFTTTVEVMR